MVYHRGAQDAQTGGTVAQKAREEMSDKLKPCPFCGGPGQIKRKGNINVRMQIECLYCKASVESGDVVGFTRPESYKWNQRHPGAEVAELKAWKESALKVMPDFQVIGKLMGLPLGTDVSSQIVPWMTQSKQQIAAMASMLDGTMATFAAYLNVPESRELRDRWAKLKSELGVRKRDIQPETAG
jgi:restriction alleviation protein Lar